MHFNTAILLLGAVVQIVSAFPSQLVARDDDDEGFPGHCDLTLASMPQASVSPLPPPADGMKLYHVALGRGTQNYTCATADSSSAPVAIGAVAKLFNASCIAASFPELLAIMPNISMREEAPSSDDRGSAVNRLLSGHHYFTDNTTPYFNLDTDLHSWGAGAVKKLANTTSPDGPKHVPWLKLVVKNATGPDSAWGEIYRLNTVGGAAPKTCDGMKPTFEVEYSSEYWFFVNSTRQSP